MQHDESWWVMMSHDESLHKENSQNCSYSSDSAMNWASCWGIIASVPLIQFIIFFPFFFFILSLHLLFAVLLLRQRHFTVWTKYYCPALAQYVLLHLHMSLLTLTPSMIMSSPVAGTLVQCTCWSMLVNVDHGLRNVVGFWQNARFSTLETGGWACGA